MKASQSLTNFNSGELSPLLEGRTELKQYVNSCRRLRNFVPAVQGPARRRPGTRFVAEVKFSANRTWLAKFVFSDDQAYVLEFGNLYIRFFANHGVVGGPFEVVTPYITSELIDEDGTFKPRMVQSGDVVYIFHPLYAPQKLTRTGAGTFTLGQMAQDDGPFHDVDPGNAVTVYASAISGGINLTASSAIFQPDPFNLNLLVGSLILLEQREIDSIKMWEPNKQILLNELRRSDGKTYKAIGGMPACTITNVDIANNRISSDKAHNLQIGDPWVGAGALPNPLVAATTYYVKTNPSKIELTLSLAPGGPEIVLTTAPVGGTFTGKGLTGTVKPTHSSSWKSATRATKYDGDNGVQWEFQDPGYGWARILTIASGTSATAGVISRLPDGVVGAGNATPRWAFSQWNVREKYPSCAAFFRERLCLMRNRDFWASVAGDFESFADRDSGGLVTADMALALDTVSDKADSVKWMASSNQALLIGTGGDEHALFENVSSEPFGPGNAAIRKQSEYGSRGAPVLTVGDSVLFTQRSGRKLRDMRMAESVNEKWVATDMTVLAEHIAKSGIVDITYQQDPDSLVWAVMSDGQLAGFTLSHEQEVRGWHPHRIGGYINAAQDEYAVVESVASIPTPDGLADEIWMIVRRTINGATKRYVEYMESFHEKGDDPEDAFYVDSGLTLNNKFTFGTLQPGPEAHTTVGATNVLFTSSHSPNFDPSYVGRYLHYRYSTINIKGEREWDTGIAKITSYVSGAQVRCTILKLFPGTYPTLYDVGTWRMTATLIQGLGHLEGQTVDILADGTVHPQQVVTGGQITLTAGASKVHVGLPCPAILQPMSIQAGSADGSAVGKTKRASKVSIKFHETGGCKYGRDEDLQLDRIPMRGSSDDMDYAVPLFSGDKLVSWPDGYNSDLLITIVQDQPLPCTVVSITPKFSAEEDR